MNIKTDKKFNAKTDLYPYTHEYYFGFFKTKQMVDFIKNMTKINPNIDFEYFSLQLYLTCLKHNLKPNKKSAYYLLQLEWRKLKKYPSELKNTNIKELKSEIVYDDITKEKEEKIIENIDSYDLYNKVLYYVNHSCTPKQKLLFKLYFFDDLRIVDIQRKLGYNSRQAVDKTLTTVIKKLKNKFGVEYKKLKLDA